MCESTDLRALYPKGSAKIQSMYLICWRVWLLPSHFLWQVEVFFLMFSSLGSKHSCSSPSLICTVTEWAQSVDCSSVWIPSVDMFHSSFSFFLRVYGTFVACTTHWILHLPLNVSFICYWEAPISSDYIFIGWDYTVIHGSVLTLSLCGIHSLTETYSYVHRSKTGYLSLCTTMNSCFIIFS